MSKQKRIFSVFLAVLAAFVLLSSSAFIAVESEHDCNGKVCPICLQINACRNTLENLTFSGTAVVFFAALFHILYQAVCSYTEHVSGITLVSLKVMLLN
ncbi:MAG: hypothetical protein PUB22_01140 [Clostridiales bacterium]|nr:hypothetical protein [Clostridiales bacterium]